MQEMKNIVKLTEKGLAALIGGAAGGGTGATGQPPDGGD